MEHIDNIIYDVGINWCWFLIRSGKFACEFRLHMEESLCFAFFKAIDNPNLFPSKGSGLIFKYGSKETKKYPGRLCRQSDKYKKCDEIPECFRLLDKFLSVNVAGWDKIYLDCCYEEL